MLFRRVHRWAITFSCAALLSACMGSRSSSQSGEDNFNDPFPGSNNTTVGNLSGNNGGSGSSGGLTSTDTTALTNLFQSTANSSVTPSQSGVSSSIQSQINTLIQQRRQGMEVTAQLMGLAGQLLQECAAKTGVLAPVPGQPLLGDWAQTSGNCNVSFKITGAGPLQQQPNNQYTVSGETNGTMVADTNGFGVVNANPWSGNIRDTPETGNGVLRHPTYYPATGGKNPQPAQPCDAPVGLKTSANPIPANYTEATRRLGCCFRQSLMLMSPNMVQLMAGMDPRLAALLVQNSGCPSVQ